MTLRTAFLLTSFLFIGTIINAQNRSIEFDHDKWSDILAKAKKENKMIYLDCYTSWCGPCKFMAKNIFTNDTVADFYNTNFINAKIDMEKGEGVELAKKYNIRAYPIMLYLSNDGMQLHRVCGSMPAKNFIESGKNALNPERQLVTATQKFNSGKMDAAFASDYFSMLQQGCEVYSDAVQKYFATQKDEGLRSRNNWNMIYKYIDDYSSAPFTYLENNKAVFSTLYSADSVEDKINKVYASALYSAVQNKDDDKFEFLKTRLRESGIKGADKLIQESDLTHYIKKKDWKNYALSSVDYISKYGSDNASVLNGVAWTFYENVDDKALLEKAAEWSKRATEIENIYAYNDTYAAVLYKLGKKSEAQNAAEKAIELAKKSGDDYKETEALLKKISKLK